MSDAKTINLKQCPVHMPKNWEPPVPAFSADVSPKNKAVVLYVGIQNPTSECLFDFNEIIASLAPPKHDFAMFTDRAGHTNYVLIAYFRSSPDHVQWEDQSGLSAWWEKPEHDGADYGLWTERYNFDAGQFETLFSNNDFKEGVCSLFKDMVGPIREHGYPGGVEDRIINAGPDGFQSDLEEMPTQETYETKGKRITLKGPDNLCVIRSGQNLTAVEGEELETYNTSIEPALSRGLKFLAENPETGCFESRYMTHCTAQGATLPKTFGMQVFMSISHMIDWAKSHPTHLEIFGNFQDMAIHREGQFELRLWHEVAVMRDGDSYAEYINCDPLTGLLPYAHALEKVSN